MTEVQSDKLVIELQKRIKDSDLAARLGKTSNTIDNWQKKPGPLSSARVASLVNGAMNAEAKREREKANQEREKIYKDLITPIIEYFPIPIEKTGSGRNTILPGIKKKDEHPVRVKLEDAKAGIYIFYDSRGRSIYVGKTTNSLWLEMNNAYKNRSEKMRRIDYDGNAKPKGNLNPPKNVKLHELARFFSAYEIDPRLTHNIEVLILRAFANDLPVNTNTGAFK